MTIGVPYQVFFKLIPNDLKSFYSSYKQKQRIEDEKVWKWFGSYGISALEFAIDHCFNGKDAKTKYIDKPLSEMEFENDGLTEDEIQEKELRKALLAEEQWIISGKQKGLPETII